MNFKRKPGEEFTEEQRNALVQRYTEGVSSKQLAKEFGCTSRYVYTMLNRHTAITGEEIVRQKYWPKATASEAYIEPREQDDAPFVIKLDTKKPTADTGQLERENEYLRWVAKGAINGWVDRLIQDIKEGSLT